MLDECIFFEDGCVTEIRYTYFICDVDGSKMYALNKIRRKSSLGEIKSRCDRPMVDATRKCENYKFREG